MSPELRRAVVAEFLGTALLLWAIVGSGIVVTSAGPAGNQLFVHALVVGLALSVFILMFGPVSGAHFNPAVTLAATLLGHLPRARAGWYVTAQAVGAVAGTMLAHVTAAEPVVSVATRQRSGPALLVSEVAATCVLVLLIFLLVRARRTVATIAGAVGAYIAAAIVFTPSTSFANPAVTAARTLSDTFTGIAPSSAPGFIAAQIVGALVAVALVRCLTGASIDAAA